MPSCAIDDSYANGYGLSKWASEVLLREAHDLCGLPVDVYRPGMNVTRLREDDVLSDEQLLPGFRCLVRDLLPVAGEQPVGETRELGKA